MSDHLLTARPEEEIGAVLQKLVILLSQDDSKKERIILTLEDAAILCEQITDLESAAGAGKPTFLLLDDGKIYLQPAVVALIGFNPKGDAVINLVNGTSMQIDALSWALVRDDFHKAVKGIRVRSSHGLVSA